MPHLNITGKEDIDETHFNTVIKHQRKFCLYNCNIFSLRDLFQNTRSLVSCHGYNNCSFCSIYDSWALQTHPIRCKWI